MSLVSAFLLSLKTQNINIGMQKIDRNTLRPTK